MAQRKAPVSRRLLSALTSESFIEKAALLLLTALLAGLIILLVVNSIVSARLLSALTSESFIEKAALLLLTALLTGLIIPLIVKSIEASRIRSEANLQAQYRLIDDLSEAILTFETLVLDVSWYGTQWANNKGMQEKAFERYSERVVELASRIRTLASRARFLVSPDVGSKIEAFLSKVMFLEQDTPINQLYNKTSQQQWEWDEMHKKNEDMASEAYTLISEVANDMGLSRNHFGR
jgi:hypothetical protein